MEKDDKATMEVCGNSRRQFIEDSGPSGSICEKSFRYDLEECMYQFSGLYRFLVGQWVRTK